MTLNRHWQSIRDVPELSQYGSATLNNRVAAAPGLAETPVRLILMYHNAIPGIPIFLREGEAARLPPSLPAAARPSESIGFGSDIRA